MASAYYNEIDPNAAQWLRELIKMGAIAPGDVDERSIEDVFPDELRPYSQCHFFAGVGGWSLALRLAGWPDDRPVWTGSAPCQPFSSAGKGGGTADERHLWPALFWLISQCRPETVFGEQVASKDGLAWWDIVSADLEGAGYACGANDLCAPGVGAFHIRQRLYWVANTDSPGRGQERELGGLSQIRSRRADKRVPTPGSSSHYGVSTLANADSPGRQWQGQTQSAGRGHNPIALGGEQVSPLARPESPERECTRGTRTGRAGSTDCVVMGDPSGQGLPIAPSNGETPAASGAAQRQTAERTNSHIARPWDNPIWLPCADGKARPAQSSIFPLVAGLPRGVGYSGDPCPQTAQNTAEGRVMRLKGYGNAIVPQLAAEFVGAAMESLR
jgi:DNA (cytosine-5)-methyltransferase 1